MAVVRPALADSASSDESARRSPFEVDVFELELGASPFVSIQKTTDRRPQIDDVGGTRYWVGKSWAVYGEVDVRPISNGRLANRNLGLDSVGVGLGVARFF